MTRLLTQAVGSGGEVVGLEVGAKPLRRCALSNSLARKNSTPLGKNSIAEIIALTGFKSRATFYKYVVNTQRQE